MKKTILFLLLITFCVTLEAKQPTTKELQAKISASAVEIKALKDSLAKIPDTLCVTALDSTFCFPTKDAQEVVIPVVDYIKETSNNGWPKTWAAWMAWILGIIPLIFAVKKLTAINNVWKILQPYLKTRLGFAILSGGALASAVVTVVALISKNPFSFSMLMVLWPWAALGASFFHNIKDKKTAK